MGRASFIHTNPLQKWNQLKYVSSILIKSRERWMYYDRECSARASWDGVILNELDPTILG